MMQMQFLLGRAAAFLACIFSIGITPAGAEVLELAVKPRGKFIYGDVGDIHVMLRYAGDACPATPLPPPMKGTLDVLVDNVRVVSGESFFLAFYRSCQDGIYTAGKDIPLWFLNTGTHTVKVSYTGEPGIPAAQSSLLEIDVRPGYTSPVAGFVRPIGLGISSLREPGAGLTCNASFLPRSIDFSATPPSNITPPPGADFRYGFANFQIPCYYECGFLCPPLPPIRVEQRMQIEAPEPLAAGTVVWAYTPSADNPSPNWQPLPTAIDGRLATVTVQGGYAGGAPVTDGLLRGTIGLALPAGNDVPFNVQDMWWGGAGENGWGASILQVANRIVMTLLVYDSEGEAAWYILNESAWDAARKEFSGSLYRPNARRMGPAVGSATLAFTDGTAGMLRYEIDGQRGSKPVERLEFGPPNSQVDPHAGFWELTAAGTGALSVNKRGDSLFVSWLEFPGGGPGKWLVSAAGRWVSSDTFEATLYRPTSSAWAAGGYDPGRLRLQPAGSFSLRFIGADRGEISYTLDGVAATSPIRRYLF